MFSSSWSERRSAVSPGSPARSLSVCIWSPLAVSVPPVAPCRTARPDLFSFDLTLSCVSFLDWQLSFEMSHSSDSEISPRDSSNIKL